MSDVLNLFDNGTRIQAVRLPLPLPAWLTQWDQVRRGMLRSVDEGFTRDEWAYLVSFLDPQEYRESFPSQMRSPALPWEPCEYPLGYR